MMTMSYIVSQEKVKRKSEKRGLAGLKIGISAFYSKIF